MRRRTAILLCLAVVSVGAGAYFVIGALSGDEPAKAGAPARATAQAASGAPAAFADDRPILERGTREPAHERHPSQKHRSRSTAHRSHRSSHKRADTAPSRAPEHDPGIGGLTGGEPAPDPKPAAPVPSPAAPVPAVPQAPAPAVPVPSPPQTTIGQILDLIGAVTGAPGSSSPAAPGQLPQDCPASSSGPGSGSTTHDQGKSGSDPGKSAGDDASGSQSGTADLVSQIIDALCAGAQANPDHKGENGTSGGGSGDRSGPGDGAHG